jgi:hypothetical protein
MTDSKKKFEVKVFKTRKGVIKHVFVDGELFDWSFDERSLEDCRKMGPEYFHAAQKDIEKHYLESLSEFVGRELTPVDLLKAIKTGWI